MTQDLDDALQRLSPLADAADAEFVGRHREDSTVLGGLEQAGKLSRAELAARA